MTDPYLNHAHCVARLIREWEKHGKLIVALDFDDTCFPFHGSGDTYPLVTRLARECSELGWYIVVFTASHPDRYPMMREYLAAQGITVSSINENPPSLNLPFGKWGKVYYNAFLDDRAGLAAAYQQLREVVDHVKQIALDKGA